MVGYFSFRSILSIRVKDCRYKTAIFKKLCKHNQDHRRTHLETNEKKRVGPISQGKKGRLMEEKIQQAKMYNMREFSPNQIKL